MTGVLTASNHGLCPLSEYEALNLINVASSFYIINNAFVSFNTLIENKHYFNTVEQPPDAAMA